MLTKAVLAYTAALLGGLVIAVSLAAGLGWAAPIPFIHSGVNTSTQSGWAFDLGGVPAPSFTLLDQNYHPRTLAQFRGREVVLTFIDSECTSVCPLTAEILKTARQRLGIHDRPRVALVAINANPLATSVETVRRWSVTHHMMREWSFLTGTPSQLRRVYRRYKIYDAVTAGKQVVHDAAVIVIDARGSERLYFNTVDSKRKRTVLSEETAYSQGMAQVLAQG